MTTRRTLLRHAAVGGALSLAPRLLAAESAPTRKLGVALVGLGNYSTSIIAPALQLTRHCELKGIVTGTPSKVPVWTEKYGIRPTEVYDYANFDKIAENPAIDVVYVILPPSMHKEYTVRAAKAGKHVWCEKPMAPSVADCEEMIRACAENKVRLSIGYRLQHEPGTQAYRSFAKERSFGAPVLACCGAGYIESKVGHWKLNRALGGGVMGDIGVYAIQGARLAIGEEPVAVTARFHNRRPELFKEVEETAVFQLEFPSGALASCHASFGMGLNFNRANFERGWFRIEPFFSYKGLRGESSQGPVVFKVENQQALQMDNDAKAILDGVAPLVPGEEGLRDIRVVEAVYRSVAQGGKRVMI
jgi:glucose-fructose oxidoreductase